ncbi:hypothetical protein [Vallitalea guaymasensis]|nr:hypothetical protein [Vallitalea guaymasensis]
MSKIEREIKDIIGPAIISFLFRSINVLIKRINVAQKKTMNKNSNFIQNY